MCCNRGQWPHSQRCETATKQDPCPQHETARKFAEIMGAAVHPNGPAELLLMLYHTSAVLLLLNQPAEDRRIVTRHASERP